MPPLTLPDPPLTDGVLTLRGPRADDRDALVAALQDPEIPRWTTVPSPYGPEEFDQWLERQDRERRAGQALWLLAEGPDGSLVGAASLHELPSGRPDIGYWVAREHRGHGHARRAVALLRRHAAELGFREVDLLIQPGNAASIAVARAAGFVQVGGPTRCPRSRGDHDHLRFTAPTS